MSMSSNLHIQEIMLRYLNGETTADESQLLQDWIREDPSHAEEFKLTERIWTDTAEAALLKVDTEKAWQSVSAKTVNKSAVRISTFSWKRMISIAASVLLVAGALYYWFQPAAINWSTTVASNGTKQLQLADGSEILLRQGSKLSLPDNYGLQLRQVKLEGEAYFKIKHNEQIPFSIETSRSIIRDLGTAFLVQSTGATEQVTVMEGEISYAAIHQQETPVVLRAGESALMQQNGPQKNNIDTANILSWSSRILIFNNTPLSKVAGDLRNYYSIEVDVPENLQTFPVTAEFRDEPLEQVIQELHLLTGLQLEKQDNKLVISK